MHLCFKIGRSDGLEVKIRNFYTGFVDSNLIEVDGGGKKGIQP